MLKIKCEVFNHTDEIHVTTEKNLYVRSDSHRVWVHGIFNI